MVAGAARAPATNFLRVTHDRRAELAAISSFSPLRFTIPGLIRTLGQPQYGVEGLRRFASAACARIRQQAGNERAAGGRQDGWHEWTVRRTAWPTILGIFGSIGAAPLPT
jgi:hypothetical protein